jgi:hypothetical protein
MMRIYNIKAGVSRAGARTGLQLPGHGDVQGFNSSSPAITRFDYRSGVAQWLACLAHNPKVRGSKPRSATFLVR